MKILFAASEAAPFAKTGGLADVAGSLPLALAEEGHDVRVIMPRYRVIDRKRRDLRPAAAFHVPLGSWQERCDVLEGSMGKNIPVYFVDKDKYFDRAALYGTPKADYPDNAERFAFFSRAVLELCKAIDFEPDIIHCNDWQTGLVPLYLNSFYRGRPPFEKTRTVFTIHNLGYQGIFWHWDMPLLGLGWELFTPEGIEFWGHINLLKAGLVSADVLTTVSKTYSREIQTPEYGHGLEGILARRSGDLYGIVNGIDYEQWNPSRDESIAKKYSPARLAGKADCRKELMNLIGLPVGDGPIVGMVTRLVGQKGFDILADSLPAIMSLGVRLVVLGTGEEQYEKILKKTAARYPDRMRVLLKYDEALAKKIYAGGDLFLMPSRYEPCGLGQLIALRYGTVPVVRKTGGLADTIRNYNPKTHSGTGFSFEEYSSEALIESLERAASVYREPRKWRLLMQCGMKQDFSWEHSAGEYVKVYRKAMKKA